MSKVSDQCFAMSASRARSTFVLLAAVSMAHGHTASASESQPALNMELPSDELLSFLGGMVETNGGYVDALDMEQAFGGAERGWSEPHATTKPEAAREVVRQPDSTTGQNSEASQ